MKLAEPDNSAIELVAGRELPAEGRPSEESSTRNEEETHVDLEMSEIDTNAIKLVASRELPAERRPFKESSTKNEDNGMELADADTSAIKPVASRKVANEEKAFEESSTRKEEENAMELAEAGTSAIKPILSTKLPAEEKPSAESSTRRRSARQAQLKQQPSGSEQQHQQEPKLKIRTRVKSKEEREKERERMRKCREQRKLTQQAYARKYRERKRLAQLFEERRKVVKQTTSNSGTSGTKREYCLGDFEYEDTGSPEKSAETSFPKIAIKKEPIDIVDDQLPSIFRTEDEFVLPGPRTLDEFVQARNELILPALRTLDEFNIRKRGEFNLPSPLTSAGHMPILVDVFSVVKTEPKAGQSEKNVSKKTKDRFDVYGEYVATKLRKLDWNSYSYVRKAIGDVILEAEMGKFTSRNLLERC